MTIGFVNKENEVLNSIFVFATRQARKQKTEKDLYASRQQES